MQVWSKIFPQDTRLTHLSIYPPYTGLKRDSQISRQEFERIQKERDAKELELANAFANARRDLFRARDEIDRLRASSETSRYAIDKLRGSKENLRHELRQLKETMLIRSKEKQREIRRRDDVVTEIGTRVSLLFNFFSEHLEILSGACEEINNELREYGAIEICLCMCRSMSREVRGRAASALARLSWNGKRNERSSRHLSRICWMKRLNRLSEMVSLERTQDSENWTYLLPGGKLQLKAPFRGHGGVNETNRDVIRKDKRWIVLAEMLSDEKSTNEVLIRVSESLSIIVLDVKNRDVLLNRDGVVGVLVRACVCVLDVGRSISLSLSLTHTHTYIHTQHSFVSLRLTHLIYTHTHTHTGKTHSRQEKRR